MPLELARLLLSTRLPSELRERTIGGMNMPQQLAGKLVRTCSNQELGARQSGGREASPASRRKSSEPCGVSPEPPRARVPPPDNPDTDRRSTCRHCSL